MSAFDPKPFLANLSQRPGVYRMLAENGEVLYVGKARNLKNRVGTYFTGNKAHAAKTMAMVSQIASIEVTATASETEALLLEYNLIKRHRPRYNVTLRDDKSFPYLYITTEQDYPRISFYRGSRKLPDDSSARTRMRAQLARPCCCCRSCSCCGRAATLLREPLAAVPAIPDQALLGPCVGLISVENYKQDVADAIKVLEGRGAELIDDLARRMEAAAQQLEFERAARLRDQINGIKAIHSTQSVTRNVTEGHRCGCARFARRRSLRFDRVRARRPQPGQLELLPARRVG
jgi:excinuclease ABC subunit C